MRRFKQGTISWFIGCHSIGHSICVTLAWRKLYKKWPKFWELCCIFLHDIGHIGMDYLDSPKMKEQHWALGAAIALHLFGNDGYNLTAGHSNHSGAPRSRLYYADKYSWLIAPTIWLWWNSAIAEPALRRGMEGQSALAQVRNYQRAVRQSVESGEWAESHSLYLKQAKGEQ